MFYKRKNDASWTIEYASDGCLELTGYTSSELLNNIHSFLSIIHIHDHSRITAPIDLKSQNSWLEYRIIDRNGRIKWVKDVSNAVYNEKGELLHIEGYLQDITYFKDLSQSEKVFRSLQNAVNKGSIVSVTDLKGNIIYANDNFCAYSKYNLSELIGKNHRIINSGHHSKHFFIDLWTTISIGKIWRGEICNKAKDGSLYWVDTIITPVFDQDQKIEQFLSIRNIITDKKNTEETLIKTEERIQLALQGSNEGLWDLNIVTNNIYLSPRWFGMLGYDSKEYTGNADEFKHLIHPDDHDKIANEFKKLLKSKSTEFSTEYRMLHQNGSYIDILSKGKLIRNVKEENIRMIGTHSDITERKKAEKALIKSEERLRKVIDSVNDVIYTISKDGTFASINIVFEHITGWKVSDWIGQPFAKIIHPEDMNVALNSFKTVMAGGKVESFELRIRRKSGKYLYTEITASSLIDNGEVISTLGIARDISYRKEAELKLKHVFETVSVKTGLNYFSNLTKYCCEKLNVKYACIGLYLPEKNAIQTISFRSKSQIFDNFTYSLDGTPCEKVIKLEGFNFLDQVQKRFPLDESLKNFNIHSYMGYPLMNEKNEVLGLMTLMNDTRITDQQEKENILSFVLARTANEISRSLAETKLKESEEFNKGILSSLTSHIAVINQKGEILTVNNAWNNFSKANDEPNLKRTGIGSNYFEVCLNAIKQGDKLAAQALKGIKSVLNEEVESFQMEYPCNSKHKERWFILSVTKYEATDLKVVVRHIDITERRKIEKQLSKSEKNYRELIENSQDIIFSFDKNGQFIFTNKFCQNALKYTSKELLGLKLFDIIHKDHHGECLLHLKSVLSGKKNRNIETVFVNKNKKNIYVEGSSTPIIEDGEIIGVQSFFRDISERKKVEINLKKSEHRYQNLVENINDAIIVRNLKGKIIFANQLFLDLLGLKKDDLIDLSMDKYIAPGWQVEIQQQYKNIIHGKETPELIEYEGMRSDGTTLWLQDKITLLIEDNKISGTQAVIRNITELKRKEAELKKLIQELTNRNNEMMQFNYIVSHNLRAPIANIIGLSNLISNENINENEGKKIIDHIKVSSQKMDEMVKDLSLVLNTRSNLNAKKETVNLQSIIHSISETLEEQLSKSGCDLIIDIKPNANSIFTIKSYMESILFNLLSNSIKYRSAKRQLKVIIRVVKVDNNIHISISDNGTGIDLKENGAYIFGLYKRFNYEVEGKGLGLHMTKAQVEALGGSIDIESTFGKGTTFKIELPK